MHIMIYALRNREVGHGHWYRALALAEAAELRGHRVTLLSDYNSGRNIVYLNGPLNAPRLAYIMVRHAPDWLLFDIPSAPEEYLVRMARDYNCRSAWLDAGPDDQSICDLLWIQDHPGTVILRTGLQYERYEPTDRWLVFGGAADKMGLLRCFASSIDQPAWLVTTDDTSMLAGVAHGYHTLINNPISITNLERRARKACLAMGQTAWECAALGVPLYLFSIDEKHLVTARKMAQLGYAQAWEQVGIPDTVALTEFLSIDFVPHGPPVSGGAERLLNALERSRTCGVGSGVG